MNTLYVPPRYDGEIRSFTASKTKNIGINETIEFVVNENNDYPDALYEFHVNENGKWVRKQAMSSKNTFSYTPSEIGDYKVKVFSKCMGSTNKYDNTSTINFVVSSNPSESTSTVTSLTCDTPSPIAPGSVATFTATSTNPDDTLYEFYVLINGKWVRTQKFSRNNTFKWTAPKVTGPSYYKVRVYAKNVNSENKADSSLNVLASVGWPYVPYTTITDLTADKTSAPVGDTFNFTATAASADNALYQFYVLSNGKWTLLQDWSDKNTTSYTPTAAGTYKIRCFVKHVNSTEKNNGQLDIVFTAK